MVPMRVRALSPQGAAWNWASLHWAAPGGLCACSLTTLQFGFAQTHPSVPFTGGKHKNCKVLFTRMLPVYTVNSGILTKGLQVCFPRKHIGCRDLPRFPYRIIQKRFMMTICVFLSFHHDLNLITIFTMGIMSINKNEDNSPP